MTRRRNPALAALAAALGGLAIPAIANAGVTGVTISSSTSPFGCADITAATSTVQGTLSLPGGPVVGGITTRPVAATACGGGAGRSISFDSRLSTNSEGLVFSIRGDDEATDLSARIPTARREGTTLHLLDLTPGSTVDATPVTGTTLDIPAATPNPMVTIPVGGRNVVVRPYTSRTVYFYGNTSPDRTSVQINDAASGIPVVVEGRDAGGNLVFTRTLPAAQPGADDVPTFFDYPPLGAGATLRVVQQGVVDRTRRFGTAQFTADGFRVALPSDAERGTYGVNLALHAPSEDTTSPLGPCNTLTTTGPLPSNCTGLTAPRTSVEATGLLPVGGDSVEVNSGYSDSSDSMGISETRNGISFDASSGYIGAAGIRGPFQAALTLPGGRVLRHRGVAGDSESDGGMLGPDPFPAHAGPGSSLRATAGAVDLTAAINLSAEESGGRVSGRATPGAHVRVSGRLGRLTVGDATTTAAADGTYSVQFPGVPRGSEITVVSGDPGTRAATQLRIVAGHRPVRIAGATDGAPVRGVVDLTADADADVTPEWVVARGFPGTQGRTLALDTRQREDGPLRVEVRDGFVITDYLYLDVDNTAPSGGAGADQRVRPGQQVVFVTGARDDGGLATVSARFGDRSPAVQIAGGAAGTIRHRFAKGGRYTVRVTLTDRAGNVTQDTATVRVSGAAPALRGAVPTRAARRGTLRFTQRASAAGRVRVQLMNATGRTVLTRTTGGAAKGKPIRVSLPLTRVAPGRYLIVRQFIGDAGEIGAVKASRLTIR
ncbi:MAG: PKD domain-containing protein [Thermoleophilia bacterium]|nr:PKD domain-containing protein [Thermoleophilia bacterium]